MNRSIPTPFSAHQEETQLMDHYGELSGPGQRVVIAVLFLAILAGIIILRDMLKTAEESGHLDEG